jgi:hypothetical protein
MMEALVAAGVQRHGKRQCNPIGRHNACEASPQIVAEARRATDVIVMYIQDYEATNDEKEVHASVAELKSSYEERNAIIMVQMPGRMIEYHGSRSYAAASLDAVKSCSRSIAHPTYPIWDETGPTIRFAG